MSFALVHQGNKNNIGRDVKASTTAKPSSIPPRPHDRNGNSAMDSHASSIHLQRAIGNQALQRLVHADRGTDLSKTSNVQPRLNITSLIRSKKNHQDFSFVYTLLWLLICYSNISNIMASPCHFEV
jgi:hypothetical protein